MASNKTDADTVQAMRLCETHLTKIDHPPALGEAIPFDPEWAVSCNAIRTKMYNAAMSATLAKTSIDKSFVDGLAAKN
jgi:hypothetical protein